jgi:hypothetical protein
MRPGSDSGRFHSHPPIANFAKLNRQTPDIERLATRRKQTPAICSNRQKINFSPDENQPLNAFLSGTASHIETGVTRSKQIIASFLSGARTVNPAGFTLSGVEGRTADRCASAFLTGSGSHSKMDVTRSKQTSGTFLTGSRIACLLPRYCRVFASTSSRWLSLLRGSRLAARAAAAAQAVTGSTPLLHAPSEKSTLQDHSFRAASLARASAGALDPPAANLDFRPFLARARTAVFQEISNRELRLLEPSLNHRKQRVASRSNRELSTNQAVAKSGRFVYGFSEKSTLQNHSFRAGSPARAFARALNLAAALLFLFLHPVASFAAAPPIHRQAAAPVLDTTVCEITEHPLDFEGKMVRVKAHIVTRFKSRVIEDADKPCSRVMRLTYSTEAAPASSFVPGPDTPAKDLPRPTLIDDDQFKLFKKYLAARMYPTSEGAPCSPCDRYEISATLTGMVNFPVSAKSNPDSRNPRERLFFLQSLAGVTARDLSATYDPKKYSTEPPAFSRGYVSGRLLGPDGKPLPYKDVQIFSTEAVPDSIKGTHQLTDDQGQFNFEVAPGQYIVAINLYTGPSKELPYGTTYLPGTTNVISATMIQLQAGQHVEHLTLQLSAAQRLRERKFSGKVEWPDGRAATDVAVWLNEDEHHQLLMKGPAGHTDAAGNFTLIGFEGRDYFLHANVNLAGKSVCAKKLRLNSTAPPDAIDLKLSVEGQIPCLQQ